MVKYDGKLLDILESEHHIEDFLDAIFFFLYRRTDFFRHLFPPYNKSDNRPGANKYGFRPGVAKKLVLNSFKKFESLAAESNQKLKESYERRLAEERAKEEAQSAIGEAVAEETVETMDPEKQKPEAVKEAQETPGPGDPAKEDPVEIKPTEEPLQRKEEEEEVANSLEMEISEGPEVVEVPTADEGKGPEVVEVPTADEGKGPEVVEVPNVDEGKGPEVVEVPTVDEGKGPEVVEVPTVGEGEGPDKCVAQKDQDEPKPTGEKQKTGDEDTDEDAELSRAQKYYQSNPDSYNGAIRENYRWSQSISDLDIRVKVSEHVKKGKQVSVKVDRKHLKVAYADCQGSEVVAVDGDLCWEVHKDETIWSLVPGEHVHISTEKVQERWWDALLEGESKISTRKIDASRPITDLGDEEQAKVEEMMYNERQKRLGLPQSHELKTHEMLRKAWDAEGSPFKGQPFDPSKFNISGSGF